MRHRAEIDGLRAVAVIPVILFHAGFAPFGGGFVGVDVFFVISGYLITTILVADLEGGQFSLARFYERRARRILPALFVVMLACLPLAWLWMLPGQMRDLGESAAAVSLFVSNILFHARVDYFAPAADLEPLLHTWSLAVEEQFYLLFPIILAVIWRSGPLRVVLCLVLVGLASFGLSLWAHLGYGGSPAAAFYLAPMRAWELMAGALCALAMRRGRPVGREAPAIAGLVLIIASVLWFDVDSPLHTFAPLLAVVGTCAVILWASSETATGRVLSFRPVVGIGLISYSAYLWHQPLFAFARLRSLHDPAPILMGGLALSSLALGYASWRIVERPFRRKSQPLLPRRMQVFGAAVVVAAGFVCFGLLTVVTGGLPARTAPNGVTFAALDLDRQIRANRGLSDICGDGFTLSPDCRTGDAPDLLLWGDSYAMHLAQAFVGGNGLIQQTTSACAPLDGIALIDAGHGRAWAADCIAFTDQVLSWLSTEPGIRVVVMSSSFALLHEAIMDRNGHVHDGDNVASILAAMTRTSDAIRAMGKIPVVIGPTPQTGEDIGRCLVVAELFNLLEGACDFPFAALSSVAMDQRRLLEFIDRIVPVLSLDELICPQGRCVAMPDGIPLYRDKGHLTVQGSAWLGQHTNFLSQVRSAATPDHPP
jgi:peptidoglycan/LPS O-acetylase OafA/YrhL